jgi:membrane protease YdiL (CAAX protease family)
MVTRVGLFVALFGMLIVRQLVNFIWSPPDLTSTIVRETGMWLVALVLGLIVRRGEGLPLSSIGLRAGGFGKSILWGLLIAIICMAAGVVVVLLTGYNGGEGGKAMDKLPLWLITMIVIRAGVVEELCYRGYAIERLQALGLPVWMAAAIPLAIFGVAHWTGGWANIVIALVLGAILAAFYIRRRDLKANMFGHFLVDFVGNVLPKLGG